MSVLWSLVWTHHGPSSPDSWRKVKAAPSAGEARDSARRRRMLTDSLGRRIQQWGTGEWVLWEVKVRRWCRDRDARRCEWCTGSRTRGTTSLGIYQQAVGADMSAGAERPMRDGRCLLIVPRAWVRCQADLLGSVCGLLAHLIIDRKANHGDTCDRRRSHAV